MSVIPQAALDSAQARAVRDALERDDARAASEHFLTLPEVTAHHGAWLAYALGDVYTAGRIEIHTAIAFLAALPNAAWALTGCGVLHRARKRFEWEKSPSVRLPTIALASLVHRLSAELTDSDRVKAETVWHEWFCPTVHAVVLGRPLVIEARARREVLYMASNASAFDWHRRYVFGWRQPWTPKLVEKEQWLFVPVDDSWEKFLIESVVFSEYLYAETHMTLQDDWCGLVRHRVFTWRNNSERLEESDARAHWQLIPVETSNSKRGEFMIFNAATHAYLSSPDDVLDDERRHLCCVAGSHRSDSDHRVWRVLPQRMSVVASGLAAFYGARYEDAQALFTRALSEEGCEWLDDDERVKSLVLRASCGVRLGKTLEYDVRADLRALELLGGEHVVRLVGLYPVWRECAIAVGVITESPVSTDDVLPSAAVVLARQKELLGRGDRLFVLQDVQRALAAYEEAAEVSVDHACDVLVLARHADAQIRRVKCLYLLARPEEAILVVEKLMLSLSDTSKRAIRADMMVELLLWRARCERKLRLFETAASTLVEALDALASLSASTPTPASMWLEQTIRTEVEVVRIYERQLVERLLQRHSQSEPLPEPADSTAEQLVHSLRCPLSFEFMRDPVLTPSGTSYERAMIECHLDTVGAWDPMTRNELRKDQLYPNRALKMLLETLLSEHKLGSLLASCDA